MSENSKIEWTDHTFNPWEGCQKVGPGCDHCYAETRNARFAGGTAVNWGPGAPRRLTSPANWHKPLAWNAMAEAGFFAQCTGCGRRGDSRTWEQDIRAQNPTARTCCPDRKLVPARPRVFCASLADVFDNAVDRAWRDDLATLILDTPNLDWLLLTKRIGNAAGMLGEMFLDGPPDNIWIGATITSQAEADRDIPKLLKVPAAKRFLSMEPLLGPVDLASIPVGGGHGHHEFDPIITANVLKRAQSYPALPQVDWVIVGGESGPGARPMHPDWARSMRDQCQEAGVPFLFKQWGEWRPAICDGDTVKLVFELGAPHGPDRVTFHDWTDGAVSARVGKKAAGRLLDGRTWDEVPA